MTKSWICHVCGKTFTRADHLNRHSQSHDLPEFICQICGCAFSRCSFLDRHWRLAHGNITAVPSAAHQGMKRPAESEESSPIGPLAKRVIHSETSIDGSSSSSVRSSSAVPGDVAVVPQLADLQARAAVLAEAVASSAPGQVPSTPGSGTDANVDGVSPKSLLQSRAQHPCPLCDKMFVRYDHMLRHKRVHTGDKPFFCALCAKRYTRADYLREHIISQHNTTNVKCKICHTVFPYVTLYRTHVCNHGDTLRNWYMQGEFLDHAGNTIQPCLQLDKEEGDGSFVGDVKEGNNVMIVSTSDEPSAARMSTFASSASGTSNSNVITICPLPVVTPPEGVTAPMVVSDGGVVTEEATVHVEMVPHVSS